MDIVSFPGSAERRVILGLSCSHDASACLIEDGALKVAIQLERLTRVKRDGRPFLNTRAAADYCLDAAGIDARDVDLFAFNTQNLIPEQVGLGLPLSDETFDLFDPLGERSVFVSHHLAHAFAAFFSSPFERAAVLVVDGSGGSVIGADDLLLTGPQLAEYIHTPVPTPRPPYHVGSAYIFEENGYRLVDREVARSFHPLCGSSSLGETYASVSQYVFGEWQEGGKLMGLAPYGDASAFGESLLVRDGNGRLQYASAWKRHQRRAHARGAPLEYRHLAARVQTDLEDALVDRVRSLVRTTGQTDVAYAGGVALNSVANQRILTETGVRRFYVMPASHDAGISIGAASAAHFLSSGKTKGAPVLHDFHGRSYSRPEIDAALNQWSGYVASSAYDLAEVVERLHAGQVVGWFEGGAEFGPRALGHRSILAAPFSKEMWLRLNAAIKFREEFRPYAPIVLEERAGEFFEMGSDPESPYMLRVVKVRPEWRTRLGAVTHVDGTARVQTVDRMRVPRWHALLAAFGERTGAPILVNTSMNLAGQPLVETPQQAIEMLLATHMDALVLDDRLVAPVRPGGTDWHHHSIRRAPHVEIEARTTDDALEFRLLCKVRHLAIPLPQALFFVLGHADGKTPLSVLLDRFAPDRGAQTEVVAALRPLIDDRLVLVSED
jgi:carbamoyltransferase